MISEKDLSVIKALRKNARSNLVEIASATKIPKSTVFDKIRRLEGGLIHKHTCLVDFNKMGYNARYVFLIRTVPDARTGMREFLSNKPCVNNLHITNSDFDYMFECVFKDNKEMSDFKEEIARKFPILLIKNHEVIQDIIREKFMGGEHA